MLDSRFLSTELSITELQGQGRMNKELQGRMNKGLGGEQSLHSVSMLDGDGESQLLGGPSNDMSGMAAS